MDMGSIIIKGQTGSRRAQYFWDAASGFVDLAQADGSFTRIILMSPENARKQAWEIAELAIANGMTAEAFQ